MPRSYVQELGSATFVAPLEREAEFLKGSLAFERFFSA